MSLIDMDVVDGKIDRELGKIRAANPDEAAVRHNWTVADAKYKEHVTNGRGDSANGAAILAYYVTRQAYFRYAQERGFSLEVS